MIHILFMTRIAASGGFLNPLISVISFLSSSDTAFIAALYMGMTLESSSSQSF
jgi:hypothetical protein